MTREEAKQLLPIIKAYSEGKKIQVKCKTDSKALTEKWIDVTNPDLDITGCYRVKPEPKYRPFKSAEECWQEMQKHQPFGWVKNIEFEKYFLIDEITSLFSDAQIHISAYERKNWNSFSTVFYNNTFADGTPFGIKEED